MLVALKSGFKTTRATARVFPSVRVMAISATYENSKWFDQEAVQLLYNEHDAGVPTKHPRLSKVYDHTNRDPICVVSISLTQFAVVTTLQASTTTPPHA